MSELSKIGFSFRIRLISPGISLNSFGNHNIALSLGKGIFSSVRICIRDISLNEQ